MRRAERHAGSAVLRALALFLALALLSLGAWAQNAPVPTPQGPSLPLVVGQGAGGASYSVPIQTLLFFTALSFLPAVLLLMTGFTRIVIVLSLLRQALGTQSAPPNQVIIGLSLFLTLFVMGPTLDRVYDDAPVRRGRRGRLRLHGHERTRRGRRARSGVAPSRQWQIASKQRSPEAQSSATRHSGSDSLRV